MQYSYHTLSPLSVPCHSSKPSQVAEILQRAVRPAHGALCPMPDLLQGCFRSVGLTPSDSVSSTSFNLVFTPGVVGAWLSQAQFLLSLFPNLGFLNLNVRSILTVLTDHFIYDGRCLQRNNLVYFVQKEGNVKLFCWFLLIPNKSLSSCFNKWWLDLVNLSHIFNSLLQKKDISLKLIYICWTWNTRKNISMSGRRTA